eukprot:CAMPEP_0170263766 /NCGR_PEP_ID=MMETSP0116_2-20130129/31772_1 /TAXON_ID=400756 /ORGANISM="Durinskia baltica, Strain CSIRO CS-38" /LENGTH=33 /DNA_ID= /DNA_START= /DNA_END= /DNA_ORIENTATION=
MVAPVAQKAPWNNQFRKLEGESMKPSMTKLLWP